MDPVYSDLEEGEIVDDSPPSLNFNNDRQKELPQRYVVKEHNNHVHRHRKNCRHAIRHHAKKLMKLKKTPPKKKNSPKWHDKPSSTHEKHKVLGRHGNSDTSKQILPKSNCFTQNSLIAEMKGSLRNASPHNKLSTNLHTPMSPTPFPKQNFMISESDFFSSEVSSAKSLKNNIDNSLANAVNTHSVTESSDSNQLLIDLTNNSDDVLNQIQSKTSTLHPLLIDLSQSPDHAPNFLEQNGDIDLRKLGNPVDNKVSETKEEESEDEEELRRIALATCAKRNALKETENAIRSMDYLYNVPLPDISNINSIKIFKGIDNPTTDNYEVVDMDVDEEMQDSLENVPISLINQKSDLADNLFVIDTNPSSEFLQSKNSNSEQQEAHDSDDEDFEANILRAELINNLYRKKIQEDTRLLAEVKNRHFLNQKSRVVHRKQLMLIPQKKTLINHQKSNLQFWHKRLKTAKHFLQKRSVNKVVNVKNNNKESVIPVPTQASKPTERLVITVNGESSDDSDEETKTVSEIEAFISESRQNSDANVEAKEKEIVPKAVSCLSKAQQEEYNSLMKILAKKQKSSTDQGATLPKKNDSVDSTLDDLKKLEEKLVKLQNTLKNKKESIAVLTKEVNLKKHHCMKAKLTAQHLKEQLVAAEKVRKAKLLEWLKTCDSLKIVKKSVSDVENRIKEVLDLHSKLRSSKQGQSCKLPMLPSGNQQS